MELLPHVLQSYKRSDKLASTCRASSSRAVAANHLYGTNEPGPGLVAGTLPGTTRTAWAGLVGQVLGAPSKAGLGRSTRPDPRSQRGSGSCSVRSTPD